MNLSKITVCFALLLSSITYGQTHDWAFDISSNGTGADAVMRAQAVDDNSNVYIAGVFKGDLYLGTDTFNFPTASGNRAPFVAKYDKDGNYQWGKVFTSSQKANIQDIVINSSGQIILFGDYLLGSTGTLSFGNTSLTRSAGVFVAFMNPTGTFTSAKDLGYGGIVAARSIELGPNDEIHAAMYLNGFGVGWNIVNGNSSVTGSGNFTNVIAKYNATATSLTWHKTYSISQAFGINDLSVDKNGEVFYVLYMNANVTVNGITATANTRSQIVWRRSNGNFHKALATNSWVTNYSSINNIVVKDTNTIYFAGTSYGDSMTIGNDTIYSLTADPLKPFNFLGEIKNFSTVSWSHSSTHQTFGSIADTKLSINGDFLYYSYMQNTPSFSLAGFSSSNFTRCLLTKFDRLGNLLWFLNIQALDAVNMDAIGSQDLLYGGMFTNTISLQPFSFTSVGIGKPFLARTFDYSITRGEVRSGPYCAGDTLLIPYEKVGVFDTANSFIAELSDEFGNFLGGQRELGRIKAATDSTVIGILPLFEVASSNKYRIRITSTNPVVQSFYKLDTLNLLIYSRDDADPGPDTTLCFGDTLQLSTFGGTAWQWSPAYAMDDSTLRQPLINPTVDTIYQIIINDSSGCGAPDTAQIRVTITPSPTFLSSSQSDTLVCRNTTVTLRNKFEGGTGTYYVTWYRNQTKLFTRQTTALADSLLIGPRVSESYMAILTDSCSVLIDTVYYEIAVYEPMQINEQSSDTLLCVGKSIDLSVSVSHALQDSIFYLWQLTNSTDTLSQDSTLNDLLILKTEIVRLFITNTCNDERKSFSYRINTRGELVNQLVPTNPKTNWCSGELIEANAIGRGGVDTSYTYSWLLNDVVTLSDTFSLAVDTLATRYPMQDSFTLRSILTDGCTLNGDTALFGFKIKGVLTIDSIRNFDSILCLGTSKTLHIDASGGDTAAYQYSWLLNGVEVGTAKNLLLTASDYTPGTFITVLAIVDDRCSQPDTLITSIQIPNALNTQITLTDTTVCQATALTLTSVTTGGIADDYEYEWNTTNAAGTSDSFSFVFTNSSFTEDSTYLVFVRVSDGCNLPSTKDSVQITVKPNPVVSFTNDSTARSQQLDTLLCRGVGLAIDFQSFYDLEKSPTLYEGTTLLSNTSPHNYAPSTTKDSALLYLVLDASSCGTVPDTATFTIRYRDPLQVSPITDTTICYNGDVNILATATGGQTSTYQYEWKNSLDGTILSNTALLSLTDVDTESVTQLKVSDGCTTPNDSQQVTIRVLQPLAIELSTDKICGQEINATAITSGGLASDYAIDWQVDGVSITSTTENTARIELTALTLLTATLTDGCSAPLAIDSIRLLPDIQFSLVDHKDSVCEVFETNWQVTSTQNLPYTYSWRDINDTDYEALSTSQELTLGNYSYILKAQNELGCVDSIAADIVVKERPNPSFTWTPEEADFDNKIVVFSANNLSADTYRWSSPSAPTMGTNSTFTNEYEEVGEYPITLWLEQDGCSDSLTQTLTFRDAFRYFEYNAFTPNRDGLNDVFKPYATGIKTVEYEIYNRWGEKIYVGNNDSEGWNGDIDGNPAPTGYYLILLTLRNSKNQLIYDEGVLHLIR